MSGRLKDLVENFMLRTENAAAKLSVAAECGVRMVYKVKNEDYVPSPPTPYRLAKACGASEDEALDIAKECEEALSEAKETA